MEPKNLIGTVLHFNKNSYDELLKSSRDIIPAIKEIKAIYDRLNIGSFTQSVLFDLINGNYQQIKEICLSANLNNLNSAGIKSTAIRNAVEKEIDCEIEKLATAVQSFKGIKNKGAARLESISIMQNDIFISKQTEEKLKEEFTDRIETEKQAQVYQKFLDAKKHFDALIDELKGINPRFVSDIVLGGFFNVDAEKHLEWNFGITQWIK